MPEAHTDLAQRVAATANRLRQIQADFADQDDQTRQEYLSDEVQRALSTLMPDQRSAFLEALGENFPSWDANMAAIGQSGNDGHASPSPADEQEWSDPTFVLERLVELAKDMPADQKQGMISRLSKAGLSASGDLGASQKTTDELRAKLKLDSGDTINAERVVEMAAHLVGFVSSLDKLSWQIWKEISPKSAVRSAASLQDTLLSFVRGDSDAPLTRDLEQMRYLVAGLLSAISGIGSQFGQQYLSRFAPNEIEAAAALEPGGFLVAKEIKCWRKYTELAKTFDDAALVDQEIKKIIANFVGSMRGLDRQ